MSSICQYLSQSGGSLDVFTCSTTKVKVKIKVKRTTMGQRKRGDGDGLLRSTYSLAS